MKTLSPQATVRAQARDALKNNYAQAVIAFAAALLPIFLLDGATTAAVCIISEFRLRSDVAAILIISIGTALSLTGGILASPFINGFVRVFYRNSFTRDMELNDLFYYFEKGRYSRTLTLNVSFLLRMLIPAALAYLPVFIYAYVCLYAGGMFITTVLYMDFYVILIILSTIILTLYALRYFTVLTLYVENGDLSNRELFRASKYIMRSQSLSAAKLIFSYTPWMLLCFTVLPILYVVPYMTQGLCIGAKWMTRAAYEG